MTPTILARITTRDGCPRNDVLGLFLHACSEAKKQGIHVEPGQTQYPHGTHLCRNIAVAELMRTQFSHLFFCDDDVLLPGDTFTKLAAAASQPGHDIVCGLYPTLKYYRPMKPTLYLSALPLGQTMNFDIMTAFPEGVVEVEGAATGCMLISRAVFEALGFPWFRWPERLSEDTGKVIHVTDDFDFCFRAKEKGFKVWVDGSVRCGHYKTIDLLTLMDGRMELGEKKNVALAQGYASHIPALAAVARHLPIRTVVEYGVGWFSTPTFLDLDTFPDLESLTSVEHNKTWVDEARQKYTSARFKLIEHPLSDMHACPVPAADLVFIDCDGHTVGAGTDYSERRALIARYATDPRAVVVVHDANFRQLAPAVEAAPFRYKATYIPPNGPHTAVMSNAVDVTAIAWDAPGSPAAA